MRKGLEDAGLVEGRDYEARVRNAQGDMATVSSLIDAAVTERADLIVTFSTPTLQAAMQRTKSIPIVFNYVADPVAAGAGTSDTQHAANVTGVYLIGAYAGMLPLIKAVRPGVRTLGTVYVPAEVNMVSQLAALRRAGQEAGLEIRAVAANSTARSGGRDAGAHRQRHRRDLSASRQPHRLRVSEHRAGRTAGPHADLRLPEQSGRGRRRSHTGARLLRQRPRGGHARRARDARRVAGERFHSAASAAHD